MNLMNIITLAHNISKLFIFRYFAFQAQYEIEFSHCSHFEPEFIRRKI